jgi:hypothetical protein
MPAHEHQLVESECAGLSFPGVLTVRCFPLKKRDFSVKRCTPVMVKCIGGLRCCFSLTSVLTKLYAFLIIILFSRHKHYHERLDSSYRVLYIS